MQNNKRPEDMQRITTPELAEKFIAEQIDAIRAQVGDKKVLLALSGGVESSVVAAVLPVLWVSAELLLPEPPQAARDSAMAAARLREMTFFILVLSF